MKITNSTELMKNQKHAVIMAPDKQFEVLQTQEGHALFFSIGTDNVFYCTREIPADIHGWSKVDFSSPLSANFNNATVAAKTFDVAQDLGTGTTDMALVITVNGNDYLYVSLGNVNTDAAWSANTVKWTAIPYDDTSHTFKNLAIADVSLAESGTTEYLIADVLEDPSSTVKSIYRYYIDPTKKLSGLFWNTHDISGDLEAGSIISYVGRKSGQPVDGVYTMGTILGNPQLLYTPLYNFFNKKIAPTVTRFTIPQNATTMALSTPKSPYTDLFVAAGGGLYYLNYTAQLDSAAPVLVYSHALLQGVQRLHINNTATKTVIWGLNEQGQIFCLSCAPGSEADTSAWSYPVAILSGVEGIATYINGQQNSLVIFAHNQDDTMVQLTQDAVTKQWITRSIVLPTTDINDYIETYTFTTQIRLTDDNSVPLNGESVSITSTAVCSVYINNEYHVLYANTPIQITCDETGYINIQQATDSLGGICFKLTDGTQTVSVNPMDNVLDRVKNVQHKEDLNVNVTDEKGNTKPLVDPSVSDDDKEAIANYIAQFVAQQSTVPADGTQKQIPPQQQDTSLTATAAPTLKGTATPTAKAAPSPAPKATSILSRKPVRIFGMHQKNGRLYYYDNEEDAIKLGVIFHTRQAGSGGKATPTAKATPSPTLKAAPSPIATATPGDSDADAIEVWAADAWNWLKSVFEEVVSWEIKVFDEVSHFFFTIAEEIYHFAILVINDIVEGIKFVLNKIKIFFEDLVKWLGMIFNWNNYVRTHKVLRSLFINYANYCIANIATAQNLLNRAANQAVATIDQWAGVVNGYTFPTDSYSDKASSTPDSGQNSPQANWGHQQAKNNAPNANYSGAQGVVGDLLDDFFKVITVEADIVAGAINQITEIINEASTTPITDLVKKIVAVIADVVIQSAVNVTDALLDVAAQLIGDIVNDVLAAPLNIPVISPLYKLFADEDLSLLDVVCLIVAIPVNIIYEIATGTIPFPDNAQTNALINAPDLESFMKAAAPPQLKSATLKSPAALGEDPPDVWTDDVNAYWMKIANISALVGSVGVSIFGGLKMKYDKGVAGYVIATLYGVCYLPYVAPDIIGLIQHVNAPVTYWYNDFNFALGIAGLAKSFIDISLTKPADDEEAVRQSPVATATTNGTAKAVVNPALKTPAKAPKLMMAMADNDPSGSGSDSDDPSGSSSDSDDPNDNPNNDNPDNPNNNNPDNPDNDNTGEPGDDDPFEQPTGDDAARPPMPANDPGQPSGWRNPREEGLNWGTVSPFLECGINLAWQIPVTATYIYTEKSLKDPKSPYGAYTHETNVLTLVGNTLFNFGGAITPIGSFGPPEVAVGIWVVQVGCNLGYGIASIASSLIPAVPKGPND